MFAKKKFHVLKVIDIRKWKCQNVLTVISMKNLFNVANFCVLTYIIGKTVGVEEKRTQDLNSAGYKMSK